MSGKAKQANNDLTWSKRPSVNALAAPLLQRLIADADVLNIKIQRLDNGCTIVDAGIDSRGSLEAGRRIAEICLGGLAKITFTGGGLLERWPLTIHVHTTDPVTACLASQYAGWSLSHGEGKQAFHALGSGPGRALACKEELFKDLEYQDQFNAACLVLEVDEIPPTEIVDKVAHDCGVGVNEVTLILTPTSSLAGTVQIVARVLEVAMHKTHELGFPLQRVVDGIGSAPLPPPAPDFLNAMGRTNDAILFGGFVQLFVQGDDDSAQTLCNKLPSSASRDYGKPFAQVFKEYKYDFFQIDPMLFSPARVVISVLDTGTTYEAGAIDRQLVDQSFGVIP